MGARTHGQLSQTSNKLWWSIGGLAFIYALNNNLAFVLFQQADPATITLFKSMTSFTTAVLMYFLLSRPIVQSQWYAVCFQCAGLIVFQYNPCKGASLYAPMTYFLLMTAVSMTTFSSVINDHLLKSAPISLNAFNFVMYAFGVMFNMVFFLYDYTVKGGPGLFEGYTAPAFLVVFLNSIIGIAITLVYKYGDALVKTFASAITAVILMVVSAAFFDLHANVLTWVGGLMTVVATQMYMSSRATTANAVSGESKAPSTSVITIPSNMSQVFRLALIFTAGLALGSVIVYYQMVDVPIATPPSQ
jgi:UDP-galactose transporter